MVPPDHRPARRSLGFAAVVACLALMLGACASSSDDSSSAPATTTASAASGGTPLARFASYRSKNYQDPSHWVCRPETTDDICHSDLDATAVAADGSLTVQPFRRAKAPKIDCFYVYPTISRDKTTYSDWKASPDEEGYVTLNQAARLASVCRVFAPVYRQITLAGLGRRMGGGGSGEKEEQGDPYADVLDAFKTYLANDNGGRGFVLIGHSQGSGMLNQLIREEIDTHADLRDALVGAYLAGGAVSVPDGKLVGGDFQHVPLCSKTKETGCVATWATFRSTAPPPANSFFGRPRGGGQGRVAGCVNPAAPGGSAETDADAYFPANRSASILGGGPATDGSDASPWVDASAGPITTPFVRLTDLVTVRCTTKDGFHYLEATIHGDPDDPRADDVPGDITPEWGLHLIDVNLVMGDVVRTIEAQAAAHPA